MKVIKRDGHLEDVKLEKISKRIKLQAKGLKNVDIMQIVPKVISGIREGVSTKELDDLAIKTTASLATLHPEYDSLAARLLISVIHKETSSSFSDVMLALYDRKDSYNRSRPAVSEEFINTVKKHKTIIDSEIVYSRDYDFDYLGINTLLKSYLFRLNGKLVERPQHMWMRVAVGIHGRDIQSAIDTYHKMSQKMFTHATPTLFNAGSSKPQLASCFLLHMHDDSIEGIYKTLSDCAIISQSAGGIGVHIHNIRAAGSPIYGTGGTSNGLVPMLRTFNATASYVDQCFTGETLLLAERGRECIEKIKEQDKVLTSDGNFNTVCEKKEFNYQGEVVKIETKNSKVRVTPEHLLLIIKGVRDLSDSEILNKLKIGVITPSWVSAKEVQSDDVIVSQ